MTTFDWYILRLFAKILIICFLALSGLYVTVHLFTNLDEVQAISAELGGAKEMAEQFYFPRILLFFDQTASLLILASAIFAFTLLQRNNEITALEAAGISKSRIARPLFWAAMLLVGLSVINREYLIPQHQQSLAKTAQNWMGDKENPMPFQVDNATGIVLRGSKIIPGRNRILSPEFQVPTQQESRSIQVAAETATYQNQNGNHPAGYLIQGLVEDVPTVNDDEDNTLLFAHDRHDWLDDDECFVPCSLSTEEIVYGNKMRRFTGLPELIQRSRSPSAEFNNYQKVDIHARVLRPILDYAILLLGLPLVVSRRDQNIFVAAAVCIGMVVALQLVVLGCHSLGAMRILKPATLAAWLPIMIFLPWAISSARKLVQ